jgi:hypothetical protein
MPRSGRSSLRRGLRRRGRDLYGVFRLKLEGIAHLLEHPRRVGVGEVDLVQHRHQREALREGEVKVGDRLRLHALAGIDQQQSSSTAGITARHLGTEVDVARRVDQMQQVVVALVVVYHGACLRLDGDAPLPLHVQPVENLLVAAGLDGACELQQAV